MVENRRSAISLPEKEELAESVQEISGFYDKWKKEKTNILSR